MEPIGRAWAHLEHGLIPLPLNTMWGPILGASRSAAGGYTLLYNSSAAGGSTVNSSNTNFTYYAGHTIFNDSSRIIGKVTFRMTSVGTLTGKTFVVKFWTVTGGAAQDCGTQQAVSDDVSGAAWTDQDVDFVFSSPFTTAGATNYNITVAEKSGTADVLNYITVHYITIASSPGTPAPGNLGYSWWGPATGSAGQFGTVSNTTSIACMKIYTTP